MNSQELIATLLSSFSGAATSKYGLVLQSLNVGSKVGKEFEIKGRKYDKVGNIPFNVFLSFDLCSFIDEDVVDMLIEYCNKDSLLKLCSFMSITEFSKTSTLTKIRFALFSKKDAILSELSIPPPKSEKVKELLNLDDVTVEDFEETYDEEDLDALIKKLTLAATRLRNGKMVEDEVEEVNVAKKHSFITGKAKKCGGTTKFGNACSKKPTHGAFCHIHAQ